MKFDETAASIASQQSSQEEHSFQVRSHQRWMEEQRGLIQGALLKGKEHLQALLEDVMAAVYLKDLEGRYLMANRWAEIMFRRDREEVLGKTDHELWPKEIADVLRANDLETLKAEAPLRFEQRFLHGDREHTYEATKFPLYDAVGDLHAVCGIAFDVTKLKKTEEALRRQNEQLEALNETTLALMNRLEPDALLEDILERAEKLVRTSHGYINLIEPGEAEMETRFGTGFFSGLVGERVKVGVGLAGKVVQTGKTLAVEDYSSWPARRRDIDSESLRAVVGVPLTSGTRVAGVIALARVEDESKFGDEDVEVLSRFAELASLVLNNAQLYDSAQRELAEREWAEQELHKSEERFRSLVQHSSDVVTILDESGAIIYVSPSVERVLGYAPEERIGGNAFDNVHPDDVERVKSRYAEAAKDVGSIGGPQEFRMRHADGSWRYVESIRHNLLDDPSVRGVVTNLRDVTERKKAEEALRRSEERFRSLIEGIPDIVTVFEADGTIRYDNPALERALGYRLGERVGDSNSDYVHPDDAERVEETFASAVEEPGAQLPEQFRVRHADGSWRYIEAVRTNLLDDPSVRGIVSVARDITEREEAEEALRRSEERLRTIVSNVPVVLFALDREGVFTLSEGRGLEALGLEPGEVVGRSIFEAYQDAPQILEGIRRVLGGEAVTTIVDLDGKVFEAFYEPLRDEDGEVSGVIGVGSDITERKEVEDALRKSRESFRVVFENAAIGLTLVDMEGRITQSNPALREMLGYSDGELRSMTWADFTYPEDVEHSMRYFERMVSGELDYCQFEKRYVRKDGSVMRGRLTSTIVSGTENGPWHMSSMVEDITKRKEAEEALKESEERYRAVMEQSAESIWLFDPETKRVLETNGSFQELLGRTSQELLEMTIYDFIAHERDAIDASVRKDLWERQRFVGERKFCHKSGSLMDIEVSMTVIPYEGREVICGVARDVTERKTLEEQLRHRAFYDSLTELPNRALFLDRLKHALAQTDRLEGSISVLFVDLDDFKVVNDSLGHDAGNALLIGVAERLRGCVRPGDTVARLFGDEFAVLLEAPAGLDDARRIAERVGERLRKPFVVEGQEAFVSASIGIVLSDSSRDQPGDVLRRADLAMYTAKRKRKARYEVFQPSMDTYAMERLVLENRLRRAMKREEFEVYYQPVVDLGSGEVNGLEALLRWRHPERGLVSPGEFIVLAEETGLIQPIGWWVFQEACRQAMEWRKEYPALVMSVNLSTSQFGHQPDLVSEVLEETGMDPRGLQLEITERVVMDDAEFSLGKLQELRSLGIQFAIDDYGTGYSSLSYLKRMPVSVLKIDRMFVAGLGSDQGDEAIVAGTVSLAHVLGLKVVAEGVETPDQLAKLEELGCDMAQGYYFAHPLPSEAIWSFLADGVANGP